EIPRRAKRGFDPPVNDWMRADLSDMARDLLGDATARARGLFDSERVRQLLDEHDRGVNHGVRLWNLTVLELWFRLVAARRARAAASTPVAAVYTAGGASEGAGGSDRAEGELADRSGG